MAKVLMKGNEALAESCLRAGCRFFSGYPITPQSEVMETLMAEKPWETTGMTVLQAESEVASINMVYGGAATGPAVIVDVQRIGCALGDIFMGQGDYWQLTRGGGHGDYRTIVLAPASVQESVDLAYGAFDLAEKYRHPVLIATDATIGQMIEPVELPEMKEHDVDSCDWALHPRKEGEPQRAIWNRYWDWEDGGHKYPAYILDKYGRMEQEQRWEEVQTEDAEIVMVAYGTSSRVAKSALQRARKEGLKVGLLRPITLWPFPKKGFDQLGDQVKAFLDIEMNILGQMRDDVILADGNRHPVEFYGEYWDNINELKIVEKLKEMAEKY